MAHCGWFFNIVKGYRVRGTTFQTQFQAPFFIVIFVPIIASFLGGFPCQMMTRSKGMKPFSTLIVSCIGQANGKDLAQAFRNHDILHGCVSVWITARVVQTRFVQFPECPARQNISRPTTIKVIVGFISLETSSGK
jgi:hypothetical protein